MRIYKIFLVLLIVNFAAFMFSASDEDFEPKEITFSDLIALPFSPIMDAPTAITWHIPNAIVASVVRVILWCFYCLVIMTLIRDYKVDIDSVKG